MATRIGAYEVEGQIGSGGMGAIFRGRDPRFDRPVAIKLLHPQFQGDPGIVDRFKAEAVIQAKLNHPHIVTVLDFVAQEGTLAIVMEFVDGQPLSRIVEAAGGPLAPERALRFMDQILSAMAYAHGAGLVHRDIKPSNVLVQQFGSDEVAKVMDFGIAKILGSEKLQTATGAKMGTLAYMSPEHVHSPKHVDVRSDIYSLGVVLYELATGTLPFDADSEYELMRRIVEEPLPDLRELGGAVPSSFAAVIERALAKEPSDRFQTCDEMRAALLGRASGPVSVGTAVPASTPPRPRTAAPSGGSAPRRTAARTAASTPAASTAPVTSSRSLIVGVGAVALAVAATGGFLLLRGQGRAVSPAAQQLEIERARAEAAKQALDDARVAAEARLAEEQRLAEQRAAAERARREEEQAAADSAQQARAERLRRARAALETASARATTLQSQGELESARNVARAGEADVPPDLTVPLANELAALRRLVKELDDAVLEERAAAAARQERVRILEARLDLARRQLAEGKYPEAKATCEQLLAEPDVPEETRSAGTRVAAEADESLRRVFEKSRVGPTRQKAVRNR